MAVVFEVSRLKTVWTAVLVVSALGAAGDAPAQQPSQAQLNALRSSCRGDYMAHCASVPTGGAPALNCLKQHMPALSAGCRSAVSAISPAAPAPVATATPASAPPPVMQAAPAAPPMIQAAPAAAPVAAPPGAPAARKPGSAQRQAEAATIRRACSADYRVHCAGIAPGGSASIACLKRNARTLSRGCLQALVGAPTVAAAPAAAPARAHCRAGRAAADGAGAAAGDAARGAVHHPQRLRRRLCRLLRRPASRSRPRRGLPALQQEQFVAALPAGADRAARGAVDFGPVEARLLTRADAATG